MGLKVCPPPHPLPSLTEYQLTRLCDAEILAFRKGMWEKVKSRSHKPVKIFPFGADSNEVMIYGSVAYEFKAGLNAYLAALPNGEIRSLADLIAFNETHAGEEMPYFGQERLIEAQRRGSLSEDRYQEAHAVAQRLSREEGIDRAMDTDDLDAVIAPTGGPAWVIDHVNGDHFSGGSSSLAAVAGYPNITVPAGYVQGLPVGLSFFGRAWSEPTLIRIAYAFEQASRHRQQPVFLPTLGADRS